MGCSRDAAREEMAAEAGCFDARNVRSKALEQACLLKCSRSEKWEPARKGPAKGLVNDCTDGLLDFRVECCAVLQAFREPYVHRVDIRDSIDPTTTEL